jgi:hypothetical protein
MATETREAREQPEKQGRKSAESRDRSERAGRGERTRRRRKRPKKPVFTSEAEINVPDRQTLGFLGAMVIMTLFLWGFARAACNAHPPRETRRPRVVKTEELVRDPKSAAVELFQRLGHANFKSATELVTPEAAAAVERERQACESNAAACAERRKDQQKVLSTGALLERAQSGATVRVESHVAGAEKTYLVRLERQGATWKVKSWEPDAGQFKPTSNPLPSASSPAPSGSVPAAPSAAEPASP